MLRARRQQLHGAIAQVLERRFADVIAAMPEVIAQQFEGAGRSRKGRPVLAAGRRARPAPLRHEGIDRALFKRIARYRSHAGYAARSALELGICLGLGMAQQIAMGPGAKEAAALPSRPDAQRHAARQGRERFLATWGVWFNATMTGRAKEAFERADNLLAIARELDDPDLLLEAYHARTPGLLRTADFPALKESAQEVIRLYDRERHRDHAFYFGGHDSRICAQTFYAISLWGLGFPDQAQRAAWQAIEDARSLGHAFSLAHGLNMGGLTHLLLNDVEACRAVTDELYPLAERNKFPWPLIYAKFQRGWLLAQQGEREAGIEQMAKAAEGTPVAVLQPVVMTLIAQQQTLAGRFDAANGALDQAELQSRHNRFYEAEITRSRGEVLLAQSPGNAAAAEAAFRQAMAVAARQSCRALELRAAVSLAQLLSDNARQAEARELLAPIYAAFTEGFGRPDLKAAKILLAQLS